MQKKTLLYVFGIASFLGLVLGTGFFANELRIKIIQGPDKNQLAAETSQLNLSVLDKLSNKNAATPSVPNANAPKTPNMPAPAEAASPMPTENISPNSKTNPEINPPVTAEKNDSFSFAILGDTQKFDSSNNEGGLQKAVKNIAEKNVGVVMTEGDLLGSCDGGSGCEKKLGEWKNALGSFYSKTYEMMGDNDRTGGEKADALWQKFFDLPQNGPEGYKELSYSFDFQNSHFVVLNSEKPKEHTVDKIQRDWLDQDLSTNTKDNTFVFFHEPAYPVSSKIDESLDADKTNRDSLWQILKDRKVTAVFNGHEHIASRKRIDGIYQFVFGNTDSLDHELPKTGMVDYSYQGKHYGIVDVSGKEVTVNVYSVDGSSLDSYKIPN